VESFNGARGPFDDSGQPARQRVQPGQRVRPQNPQQSNPGLNLSPSGGPNNPFTPPKAFSIPPPPPPPPPGAANLNDPGTTPPPPQPAAAPGDDH
jgi:hypothetical protein